MKLQSGSRLGPYEIVSRIGAGGMGEVFKARDTRLDRSVAIKVLPAELADNAQLRVRFDREARTISQLNHPNICTLYDVGDSYLVMELLEGETLAEVVARGPLPLPDLFRYGIQIAEALDRAHRAGIVHRDLKPGNVMITRSGAKLLDFGLAKYAETAAVQAGQETEQKPLTQEGTIVGTFQYMAPEQLEGAEAGARTDLFALGTVLYEMATGTRAFSGKTKTSLIAAIVKDDPRPISQLRPVTPPALEHVVARCLEKDPERRWQSAFDVAEELRWISGNSQATSEVHHPSGRSQRRIWRTLLATVPWLLLLALLAWQLRPVPRTLTFGSVMPPRGMFFDLENAVPVLSPDGRKIVFLAGDGSRPAQLYVRDLGSDSASPLANTEGAIRPFWSADGTMLGFFSGGKLKVMPAAGGPAQILADAPDPRGGAWSTTGTIAFNAEFRSGLAVVAANGGAARPLTKMAAGEISHRWPVFLPDGKHVLFLAQRAEGGADSDTSSIDVVSLEDGSRSQVVQANSSPIYSDSGHLLYWRDKTLFAHVFDEETRKVVGTPVAVATDVSYNGTEAAVASVSNGGTLLYQAHGALGKSILKSAARDGTNLKFVDTVAVFKGLRLSHDGRRLAAVIMDRGDDIRVFGISSGTSTRLTFSSGDETGMVWSPDDTKIAFSSNAKDGGDLFTINSSGGTEEALWVAPGDQQPTDWSMDGGFLLAYATGPKTGNDLWIYSLASRRAELWLQTPFNEFDGVFSPDGKWIAYTSDESGRSEVYVQPRDRTSKWQISRGGGREARWRRDGGELFYLNTDEPPASAQTAGGSGSGGTASIYAVDVGGGRFEDAKPVRLFSFLHKNTPPGSTYDVTADGKTFHLNTQATNTDSPLTLVQNWTQLLRSRR